jgi:hypothetical protein
MTTSQLPATGNPFETELQQSHETAAHALRTGDGERFDAVVLLSAHLMAAERTLHPAVGRHAPHARPLLREHIRADRRLHRELRALEQISSGDTLTAQLDETSVRTRTLALLDLHVTSEQQIINALTATMSDEEQHRLLERYRHLADHGATRPHPHTPSHGPFVKAAYVFDSLRDHVLDVMDSRSTPIPHSSQARVKPGRWGHYLLGSMRPAGDEAATGH